MEIVFLVLRGFLLVDFSETLSGLVVLEVVVLVVVELGRQVILPEVD